MQSGGRPRVSIMSDQTVISISLSISCLQMLSISFIIGNSVKLAETSLDILLRNISVYTEKPSYSYCTRSCSYSFRKDSRFLTGSSILQVLETCLRP